MDFDPKQHIVAIPARQFQYKDDNKWYLTDQDPVRNKILSNDSQSETKPRRVSGDSH